MTYRSVVLALLFCLSTSSLADQWPDTFEDAKRLLRNHVLYDQRESGDFYCSCSWEWRGRTGGIVDHSSCGFEVYRRPERGERIEYEHIVPAYELGKDRLCLNTGGRDYCETHDQGFRRAYTDLHNITIVVGELNADRRAYRFGDIPGEKRIYGRCDFEVDFTSHVVEPPESARGQIARAYLYMRASHGLRLPHSQYAMFEDWDKVNPPTEWEKQRNNRIKRITGKDNPYVSKWPNW